MNGQTFTTQTITEVRKTGQQNPLLILAIYIILICVCLAGSAAILRQVERDAIIVSMAETYSVVLDELHEYYSEDIAPRAVNAGAEMSAEFRRSPKAIPFPATFINDFGQILQQRTGTMSTRMYSHYPFPWAEHRVLSPDQDQILAALERDRDTKPLRWEDTDGRRVLHLARAVVMKPGCLDCHNQYDTRPGGWKVGDLRGAREITMTVEDGIAVGSGTIALLAALVLAVALGGAFVVWPSVLRLRRLHDEARQLADELKHQATHDALTGLPTLRLARDRLSQAIALARRSKSKVGLLFIDLDGFKAVNDGHGHETGDLLLKKVAGRLLNAIREVDSAARMGGDEFVVVLGGLAEPMLADRAAERIVTALSRPFEVNGVTARIGASVGIAIFPDDGTDEASLLRHADEAMYEAKKAGKNGWRRFSGCQG
jgi:diguanylate cyclase (GGDEF)-like protein